MIQEEFLKFQSQFSTRLRKVRTDANLNQTEFARKIGFSSHVSISKFELGMAFPGTDVLWKIAHEFPVDLHWLVMGQPAPENSKGYKSYIEFFDLLYRYMNSEVARLLDLRDMLEGISLDMTEKGLDNSEIEIQINCIQYKLNTVLEDIKKVDSWRSIYVHNRTL